MSGFGYSPAKPSITFSKDSQYLHKTLIQNETLSPHYMQDCSKSIVGLWPALAIPNFIKYFHLVWPSLTARFPSWVVLQIYSSLATWTVNGPLYWCFQNSLYDAQNSFVSVHNVLLQNSSPAIIPSPRPYWSSDTAYKSLPRLYVPTLAVKSPCTIRISDWGTLSSISCKSDIKPLHTLCGALAVGAYTDSSVA